MPGQNVCICATAIERTDKVVRTLRRAEQEADAWAANGEPTQVSVGKHTYHDSAVQLPRREGCTMHVPDAR